MRGENRVANAREEDGNDIADTFGALGLSETGSVLLLLVSVYGVPNPASYDYRYLST